MMRAESVEGRKIRDDSERVRGLLRGPVVSGDLSSLLFILFLAQLIWGLKAAKQRS